MCAGFDNRRLYNELFALKQNFIIIFNLDLYLINIILKYTQKIDILIVMNCVGFFCIESHKSYFMFDIKILDLSKSYIYHRIKRFISTKEITHSTNTQVCDTPEQPCESFLHAPEKHSVLYY